MIYLRIQESLAKREQCQIISLFCLKQDPLSGVHLHSDSAIAGYIKESCQGIERSLSINDQQGWAGFIFSTN